jgi:hypothetical protein
MRIPRSVFIIAKSPGINDDSVGAGDVGGIDVGASVGTSVGDVVGLDVGNSEGESLGCTVGNDVVGCALGDDDGDTLGEIEGTYEGSMEGSFEGPIEGDKLGGIDGDKLGGIDGSAEGTIEGSVEGIRAMSVERLPVLPTADSLSPLFPFPLVSITPTPMNKAKIKANTTLANIEFRRSKMVATDFLDG